MRIIPIIIAALLMLNSGCVSQKQLGQEFYKVEADFSELYLHAPSREAALKVLNDYLQSVNRFEQRGFKLVRYAVVRGIAEARIAIIYDELGEHQPARDFMQRALNDIHLDEAYKDADESRLRTIVTKTDEQNSPVWRKN